MSAFVWRFPRNINTDQYVPAAENQPFFWMRRQNPNVSAVPYNIHDYCDVP